VQEKIYNIANNKLEEEYIEFKSRVNKIPRFDVMNHASQDLHISRPDGIYMRENSFSLDN
jgi:hypothetical protein